MEFSLFEIKNKIFQLRQIKTIENIDMVNTQIRDLMKIYYKTYNEIQITQIVLFVVIQLVRPVVYLIVLIKSVIWFIVMIVSFSLKTINVRIVGKIIMNLTFLIYSL